MKRFLSIVVALLVTTVSMAQTKHETTNSINVDLLVPVGKSTQASHKLGNAVSLQTELRCDKVGYLATTGYNLLVAKSGYQNILQLPTLAGVKYYFNKVVSLQGAAGVVATNNAQGVNFIYSPAVNFVCGKVVANVKFVNTVIKGADNDIMSVGLGITYKL